MLSSSEASLCEVEAFVRQMRALGATTVRVGTVAVVFDGHAPAADVELPHVEEDPNLKAELLMYGSSD